jgi:hypothetical protein
MIGGGRARVVDRGTHRGVRRELFAEPRVSRTWLSRTPSLELGRAEPRVWNFTRAEPRVYRFAEPNPGFRTSPEPNPGFIYRFAEPNPGFTDLPSRTPGFRPPLSLPLRLSATRCIECPAYACVAFG